MTEHSKALLAWHWLADDRKTQYGRPRVLVTPGLKLSLPDGEEPELCQRGFHASVRVLDALRYAQGAVICRVRLSGIIVRGDDKVVASSREVLWMADATETLHLFACDEAERAMARVENPDQRSVAAIVAKRAWLRGEITDKQLAAARDAAWAAARVAAWAAAWDAARVAARDAAWAAAWAAARDAARAAARVAARDAAWAAAWDAARVAARDAAWAAASDAASDAARDAQNKRLTAALMKLRPKGTK
jgi:hypothetical protein